MHTPTLAVHLIVQDMRHFQLIASLENLGMDMDAHYLDLPSVLAGLLGVQEVTDAWMDLYTAYLDRAAGLPIAGCGENLHELARECYFALAGMGNTPTANVSAA